MTYTLNFNPSMETWNLAVADVAFYYEWKKIAVMYCSNVEEIQSLLQILNNQPETTVLLLNVAFDQSISSLLRIIKLREITRIIIYCDGYQRLLNVLTLVGFFFYLCCNVL